MSLTNYENMKLNVLLFNSRLLRQIPEQVRRQPHPTGLGQLVRPRPQLPLLQLHRQRQREKGTVQNFEN